MEMSTGYIHYTEEQKEQARQTDIVDLLERQGETVKRSGSEKEWRDGSAKVTIRGNLWYHQYEEVGGDAIDFVRRFYNKTYPEAMDYLLGGGYGRLSVSPPMVKESKPLVLPPQNDNMRRIYAYLLKHRNIDRDVLNHFSHEGLIYEDAKYHNVVFLGKDKNGTVRHVHKRGSGTESTYKGNESGSEPEYSFHHIGKSNRLYAFEAPIDMLSYISLHKENWKQHSYVALCSVADRAIFYTLKQHPQINEVVLCLDSDDPGQTATHRIAEKLFTSGYHYEIEIPHGKDWNDDLRHPPMETEEEPAWAIQYS